MRFLQLNSLKQAFSLFPSGLSRLRSGTGLWIETTGIIAAAIAISLGLSREDPFGVSGQFPWLLLAPLIVAMRYGTVLGIYALLLLAAAWFALPAAGITLVKADFPKPYFLGGLLIAMVAGQFADIWNSRLEKIKEVNAYLDERLTGLTRSHFLLRLSHERIEQDLLIRPTTLRDLLFELRDKVATEAGPLPGANGLLRLLAQSCEIECAGLFYKHPENGWERTAHAKLAECQELVLADPLVSHVLEHRTLAHPQADADLDDSRYLAVVPLISANKKMIGLLAVERMPFFGLNNENLQLLLVLCGYFTDGVETTRIIKPILTLRPQCPPEFALELVRLQRMFSQTKIESAMVALSMANEPQSLTVFEHLKRLKRSSDPVWELENDQRLVLVTLLTLAGSASVEGFLIRVEESLKQQADTDLVKSRIGVQISMLSAAEPEWTLDDLVNRAGILQKIQSAQDEKHVS
jgi:polysaccharide biosynthesis protein PelD